MIYQHIFWDWNGTLFNDAEAAFQAVNKMLSARELPPITFEQYRDYVDVPISRFYEKVMDMSKESMEDLSVEFHKYWSEYLKSAPLADDAYDLVKFLHEKGVKQYIFSSSQKELILPYLEKYGIVDCFDAVLASDDCYVGSKAERTKKFFDSLGVNKFNVLFIGDMVHDSDVASLVDCDCILLSCGHQSEKALISSGREVLLSVKELSTLIKG